MSKTQAILTLLSYISMSPIIIIGVCFGVIIKAFKLGLDIADETFGL